MAKVLVANKCDRQDKVIDGERGRQLAEQHGLHFFETSAKSGLNVNEVFHSIARVIVNEKLPQELRNGGAAGGMSTAYST